MSMGASRVHGSDFEIWDIREAMHGLLQLRL
jgi:hypothetical protein